MNRTGMFLVLAGLVATVAAGCSTAGPSAGSPGGSGGAEARVSIQTFQFQPGDLTVRAGTRVTWVNQDDIAHTVTSGTPEKRDGRFNASLNAKGATFSTTFDQPGTYPYFCDRHQSMRGQIRVN
jgi:plastocyanin